MKKIFLPSTESLTLIFVLILDPHIRSINIIRRGEANVNIWRVSHSNQTATYKTGGEKPQESAQEN